MRSPVMGHVADLSYSSFIMCSSYLFLFWDFLLGCAILLYYLSVNSCFNLSQRGSIYSSLFSLFSSSLALLQLVPLVYQALLNCHLTPGCLSQRNWYHHFIDILWNIYLKLTKGRMSNCSLSSLYSSPKNNQIHLPFIGKNQSSCQLHRTLPLKTYFKHGVFFFLNYIYFDVWIFIFIIIKDFKGLLIWYSKWCFPSFNPIKGIKYSFDLLISTKILPNLSKDIKLLQI
jgi:hypothetical protein